MSRQTAALTPRYRYRLGPLRNPHYQQIAFRPLFDGVECNSIVQGLDPDGWEEAAITSDGGAPGDGYDATVRSARLQQMPNDDSWPVQRLVDAIGEVNSELWRFDLQGLAEYDAPSVGRYTGERADHFRPHQDAGPQHCNRKLTYVIQLSAGTDYRGGDLLFRDRSDVAPRDQGTLIVFPATLFHVVSPVIQGTRFSLIGWAHGPSLI